MTTVGQPPPFARELLRWRTARRVSQLELASRAGTTQRYVSFIERGRSVPGRTVVIRLAESLGLTLRERNALLLAAGYAPAFSEAPLDAAELKPVREALDGILEGHLPYPAVVAGPRGELVAANAAFDVLTEGAAPELLRPPVTLRGRALHPRGRASRGVNRGAGGRHIGETRGAGAPPSPPPPLDDLAEKLAGSLPPLGDP